MWFIQIISFHLLSLFPSVWETEKCITWNVWKQKNVSQCHLTDRWINGKSLIIMGDLYIKTAYSNTWAPRPQVRASMVAQGAKSLSAMQETWVRFLGQEDPLEKEMATHSSSLAWEVPRTEKPGGLQPTRSQSWTVTKWLNNNNQCGSSCALYWEATVGVQNTQASSALRLWEQVLGAGPLQAATLLYSHYPSLHLDLKLALL